MAAVNNLMTPGSQLPQVATTAQKLHIRQLLRLYRKLPDHSPHAGMATKTVFQMEDLFHLRWLLDENSSAAHPEDQRTSLNEPDYDNNWLTQQGAIGALAQFRTFTNLLPTWIPTIIYRGAGPVVNQLMLNIPMLPLGHGTPAVDTDLRYRHVVGKIVDIAFGLIVSGTSRDALAAMHADITTIWNVRGIVGARIPSQVDSVGVVNGFLAILRNQFPTIELLNHRALDGSDAEVRPRGTWVQPGQSIASFSPGIGARVLLNGENVISAKKAAIIATDPKATATERRLAMKNWMTFLTYMGVALAHEFVHLFVVMLAGGNTPRTPVDIYGADVGDIDLIPGFTLNAVELDWFDDSRDLNNMPNTIWSKLRGESGFHWEAKGLGGKLVCYKDPSLEIPASRAALAPTQLTGKFCSGRLFFV